MAEPTYTLTEDTAKSILDRGWSDRYPGLYFWADYNLSRQRAVWSAGSESPGPAYPESVYYSWDRLLVQEFRLVRHFRIHIRVSGTGLYIKLTDASSRKVREAVSIAGNDFGPAYYRVGPNEDGEPTAWIFSPTGRDIPWVKWSAQAHLPKTSVN